MLWFLFVFLIWVCALWCFSVVVKLSMHNKIRNRGLAFITMGSPEEALTALKNLESYVSMLFLVLVFFCLVHIPLGFRLVGLLR